MVEAKSVYFAEILTGNQSTYMEVKHYRYRYIVHKAIYATVHLYQIYSYKTDSVLQWW